MMMLVAVLRCWWQNNYVGDFFVVQNLSPRKRPQHPSPSSMKPWSLSTNLTNNKVGCVFSMVVVTVLPHVEFIRKETVLFKMDWNFSEFIRHSIITHNSRIMRIEMKDEIDFVWWRHQTWSWRSSRHNGSLIRMFHSSLKFLDSFKMTFKMDGPLSWT